MLLMFEEKLVLASDILHFAGKVRVHLFLIRHPNT